MNTRNLREDTLRLERENANLRQEILSLRQFIDAMQNLVEAIDGGHSEAELMDLLASVLENALSAIGAKDGSLLVLDDDTGELVFVLTHGEVPQEHLAWRRLPPGTGIAGWVARSRKATVVDDAQSDERFYGEVDRELSFRTQSVLAAPVIAGNQVLGVIEVLNKRDGKLFNDDDVVLLTLLCRFAGELLADFVRRPAEAAGRDDQSSKAP